MDDLTRSELEHFYTDALAINAQLITTNEQLKHQVNNQAQEIAHCHAVCDELREELTKAKLERSMLALEVDEANETIAELRAKLATVEADALDREADLMLTAHKDPAAMMSRQTAGTLQIIGATMKARAALARAKAGQ